VTTVEPAGEADLHEVRRLLSSAGLPGDDLAEHRPTFLFSARDGNRVVGGAALEVHGEWGLLRSVVVDASVRGSGVGGRLVSAVLEKADLLDLQGVYLLTEGAEGFFGDHGFEIIGRSAVPAAVRASSEFSVLCPVSAVAMRR
jgi:amino-acid N-acetyltransferase